MNRRSARIRSIPGPASPAGIPVDAARRMTPGFIRDMYMIRMRYDIRVNGGKIVKNKMGL